MLAFAVLLLSFSSPDPKVSISASGAPISAILSDISRQTGAALKASPIVSSDPLIVRAKDVSLSDLLERIADADGAEWVNQGGVRMLTRTGKLADIQAKAELAYRAQQLKKDLEEKAKTALLPVGGGKNASGVAADRLAWRAVFALGPAVLASVKSGTRVVFAEDPTRAQYKWPGSMAPLMEAYSRESAVLPPHPLPPERGLGPGVAMAAPPPVDAPDTLHPAPQRVSADAIARVQVAVSHSLFNGYVIRATLYGARGERLDEGQAEFVPSELAEVMGGDNPSAPSEGKNLELSPEASDFVKLLTAAMQQKPVAISGALRERILNPERFDPLSFLVADLVEAVAGNGSKALVACVPDFAFVTSIMLCGRPVTESSVRSWLSPQCALDETHAGWMIIRPYYPTEARELRVDRARMGAFYRAAWKAGGVSLSEYGSYIATQPRRYPETVSLFYGFFVMPELAQMVQADGFGALRVYAHLSDSQRARLDEGQDLKLSELSTEAVAEANEWAFCDGVNGFGGISTGIDPTNKFPLGLPGDVVLSAQVSKSDVAMAVYDGKESLDASPMTASSIGYELGRQDFGKARIQGAVTGFRLGKKAQIVMYLTSKPWGLQAELMETRFDRNSQPLAFSELPKAFRDEAERARSNYAKEQALRDTAVPKPP